MFASERATGGVYKLISGWIVMKSGSIIWERRRAGRAHQARCILPRRLLRLPPYSSFAN